MNNIYDSIVVGAGPAGITAAIYLARRKLHILLIYLEMGGQAAVTANIENYAGFKMITGQDFTQRLNEHVNQYDITCITDEVLKVEKQGKYVKIKTSRNDYLGKTAIITTGARQKMLKIKGEKEFLNRGVAYCATCDAPLFRNKEVAIIGGAYNALEAVVQLEKYSKKVYLITKNKELHGEPILIDKIKKMTKVEIMINSTAKEIKGDKFVKSLVVQQNSKLKEVNVMGIFIEIGYQPNSDIVDVKKNELGEIIIDEHNGTSKAGIFAAGDVTNVEFKQIIVAAGDGAKTALSVAEYISVMK